MKLQRCVADHLSFDAGVVLASSSEVLANRRGTCTEYTVLLTALDRAVGIPARYVTGYVYAHGMLAGHAWTEVRIGEDWLALDAAIPAEGSADAARFAFHWTDLNDGPGVLNAGPALWRLAGSFEFDAGLREDLLQVMLAAIWQALPRLDDQRRLKAYVFRIARNRALSHVARRAGLPKSTPLAAETADPKPCPYSHAEQGERQRRLVAAVQSLPLGQREAITLFLEGFSHVEIAEILQTSENNVAVRINRARARLTENLSS